MIKSHRWLLLCAILAAGCESEKKADEAIPLDKVPPVVLKAARDKMPDVVLDTAYRDTYNGQPVYEVRGKAKNGKIRECEVNEKGEVVNVE